MQKATDPNLVLLSHNSARGSHYTWDGDTPLKPTSIYDFRTSARPALAWYPKERKLWCVYRGHNSHLYYTTVHLPKDQSWEDGITWSPPTQMPIHDSIEAPALAVLNDKLYCVYISPEGDNRLHYTSWDHDSQRWNDPKKFPGPHHNSAWGPALAAYEGKLWCVYTSTGRDQGMWYTSFDDNTGRWSPGKQFSDPKKQTAARPSLVSAEYDNGTKLLLCVHRGGTGDEGLYFFTRHSSDWTNARPLKYHHAQLSSRDGPGLTFSHYYDKITMVYRGTGDDTQLYYSYLTPGTDVWNAGERVKSSFSQDGPALAMVPAPTIPHPSYPPIVVCMHRGLDPDLVTGPSVAR